MSMPTSSAALECKLIHIGAKALGMDEDTRRLMISNLTGGKTSTKQLTQYERQQVLNHLKAKGFKVKPKAPAESGWRREPQMRKLRAMWYVLADAGEVDQPADSDACDAAIQLWAKRQFKGDPYSTFTTLRFAKGDQMSELIEAMKAWGRRAKAEIE